MQQDTAISENGEQPVRHIVWTTSAALTLHALLAVVIPHISPDVPVLTRNWGFGSITFFPLFVLPAYIIAVLTVLPMTNRLAQNGLGTIDRWLGNPSVTFAPAIILSFAAVAPFWLLRQKYALLVACYENRPVLLM